MIELSVVEKNGEARQLSFDKDEIFIGRVDTNDVVLPKSNVSKQHSKLLVREGRLVVLDLKSTNGTFVNGKKIAGPQVIRDGDKIQLGDFSIEAAYQASVAPDYDDDRSEGDDPEEEPEPTPARRPASRPASRVSSRDVDSRDEDSRDDVLEALPPAEAPRARTGQREPVSPTLGRGRSIAAAPAAKPVKREDPPAKSLERGPRQSLYKQRQLSPEVLAYAKLQRDIHERLIEHLDLRRTDIDKLGDEELWNRTEKSIREIMNQMAVDGELSAQVDRELLVKDVLNEALGLGPLEDLLHDDDISEIMVNHAQQVYIERKGKLTLCEKIFSSNPAVLGVIERIVAPIGRRIDESSPMVDARLKDGSRVNAIIPPLALKGPSITIRKFKRDPLQIGDLVGYKTVTAPMGDFLETCVRARRNMIISGGTGSGKTTTLNVVSSFIPEDERIVTIEDAAELQLHQDHWVQLETRPPNLEGKGQISIRDLVKNSLRMRPDRIVVGECRGGEALDMLQAMNTGHDGSLTTLHANTPRDALARLETLVLMSGMDLPIKAIREQIASAVNMIVQQTRFSDGSRRITAITEVAGMEVDIITLQDIFYFKQEGFDANGKIKGRFVATGFVPKFYEDMQRRGLPVNMNIFREEG